MPTAEQAAELSTGGMTCASCAARIEKKPSKLEGSPPRVHHRPQLPGRSLLRDAGTRMADSSCIAAAFDRQAAGLGSLVYLALR